MEEQEAFPYDGNMTRPQLAEHLDRFHTPASDSWRTFKLAELLNKHRRSHMPNAPAPAKPSTPHAHEDEEDSPWVRNIMRPHIADLLTELAIASKSLWKAQRHAAEAGEKVDGRPLADTLAEQGERLDMTLNAYRDKLST